MSAFFVVSALNAIHRVALLIVVLLCGAFIFLILDYYFLGLTYIIVYVGAIAILFLFVIMMIQIHIAPQERILNSSEFSITSGSSFNFGYLFQNNNTPPIVATVIPIAQVNLSFALVKKF